MKILGDKMRKIEIQRGKFEIWSFFLELGVIVILKKVIENLRNFKKFGVLKKKNRVQCLLRQVGG